MMCFIDIREAKSVLMNATVIGRSELSVVYSRYRKKIDLASLKTRLGHGCPGIYLFVDALTCSEDAAHFLQD